MPAPTLTLLLPPARLLHARAGAEGTHSQACTGGCRQAPRRAGERAQCARPRPAVRLAGEGWEWGGGRSDRASSEGNARAGVLLAPRGANPNPMNTHYQCRRAGARGCGANVGPVCTPATSHTPASNTASPPAASCFIATLATSRCEICEETQLLSAARRCATASLQRGRAADGRSQQWWTTWRRWVEMSAGKARGGTVHEGPAPARHGRRCSTSRGQARRVRVQLQSSQVACSAAASLRRQQPAAHAQARAPQTSTQKYHAGSSNSHSSLHTGGFLHARTMITQAAVTLSFSRTNSFLHSRTTITPAAVAPLLADGLLVRPHQLLLHPALYALQEPLLWVRWWGPQLLLVGGGEQW